MHQVADLDTLLQGRRDKLILLDDNLLAYSRATELLEEMARRNLSVNFNQTLDLRRLQPEQAELLRRIRCSNLAFHRRAYHFSLNDNRGLARLRTCYELLRVTSEDNAEFICMYGYDSSLAEDLERLRRRCSGQHRGATLGDRDRRSCGCAPAKPRLSRTRAFQGSPFLTVRIFCFAKKEGRAFVGNLSAGVNPTPSFVSAPGATSAHGCSDLTMAHVGEEEDVLLASHRKQA